MRAGSGSAARLVGRVRLHQRPARAAAAHRRAVRALRLPVRQTVDEDRTLHRRYGHRLDPRNHQLQNKDEQGLHLGRLSSSSEYEFKGQFYY